MLRKRGEGKQAEDLRRRVFRKLRPALPHKEIYALSFNEVLLSLNIVKLTTPISSSHPYARRIAELEAQGFDVYVNRKYLGGGNG